MNEQIDIDICECDVEDKESLAHFRKKRSEWNRFLISDKHSISQQISHLLWNDTVFRAFNEATRIAVEDNKVGTGLNGPLVNLMDEGFVASQVMSIRRLSDRNFDNPKKAVISLRRLVDDIADNLDTFTRENYICFKGTAYDGLSHEKDGINWMHWSRKHEIFDRLSGVPKDFRTRKDTLKKEFISSLRSELSKCNDLRTYANKFIAHTSDSLGRARLTDNQKRITLTKLDEAYKAIIKVASFLGAIILYEHQLGGVPVPQYNQFKYLDKAIILKSDISKLGDFWTYRNKEVSSWGSDIWPNI